MSWRTAGAVVAVGALSGCWMQPGNGPARQNFNPFEEHLTVANVADLQPAWPEFAVSLPTSQFTGQPLDNGSAIIIGGVLVSNGPIDLAVWAVDRESGAELWRTGRQLSEEFVAGAVLSIADGKVLTLSTPVEGGSALDAFDPATGAKLDSVTEDAITTDPDNAAVGGGVIAYRSTTIGEGTRLVVRDFATLDVLWTAPLGGDPVARGADDPLLIAHDHIYVRDVEAREPVVRAYDVDGCGAATCEPVWTAEVPLPVNNPDSTDVRLMAATDAGEVLVHAGWSSNAEAGADLVALTSDGAHSWTQPMLELDGLAVARETVYAAGVDAATPDGHRSLVARGPSPWRADMPEGLPGRGAPIVAGGVVYAVDGETDVRAFAADGCGAPACDALTTIETGLGMPRIAMSVSGGALFVSKNGDGPGGRVLAFTPSG